jgi:hypothetical protein
MASRFLYSLCGALLGLLAGSIAFYFTRERGASFSWWLPLVFAAIFAVVSFVAGPRFLLALVEIVTRL